MTRISPPSGQNDPMSPQQRGGGGGDVARGAGYAALLGALLIGVAVVIGILLLQIGDNNDNGPQSTAGNTTKTSKPAATTTTTGANPTDTTTPSARPPGEVRVIVLNGGAAAGQAGDMTDALKLKGYTNISPANDWTGHTEQGNKVYCREGFEREGTALAVQVGPDTKSQIPYPDPPPPYAPDHDCVVVVGAAG
jgi:LytR cell envelope-related transcriptional attenuator